MCYNPLTKEEEFEVLSKEVEQRNGYKRLPSPEKKYMSVPEMGRLLGLKKTGRYWLVHRKFFKMEMVAGKMMVELESFEKWYANQVKYHKITGEEPGLELKQRSYSARDIAEMLHISEGHVYEQMNRAGVEYILVDFWKRYPKEAFDQWYASQDRFRNEEDREKAQSLYDSTMRMPEMARLLGITRSEVYRLLETSDILKTIELDGHRRVTKESFYAWYGSQDKYRLVSEQTAKKGKREKNRSLEAYRHMVVDRDGNRKNVGNKDYLTMKEAALIANTESSTIHKWIKTGKIAAVQDSNVIRIPRKHFEEQLKQRRKKEEKHGINC
ncbi:MAG: helix-turn-helix domain-containing protein [Eubacteriales bacterium]|nr:helix-turn-helix domain-containing protein [Eubacteriales bacterium]